MLLTLLPVMTCLTTRVRLSVRFLELSLCNEFRVLKRVRTKVYFYFHKRVGVGPKLSFCLPTMVAILIGHETPFKNVPACLSPGRLKILSGAFLLITMLLLTKMMWLVMLWVKFTLRAMITTATLLCVRLCTIFRML